MPRCKINVELFTDDGKKCIERLKFQLQDRYPDVSESDGFSLLLDPRIKHMAIRLLGEKYHIVLSNLKLEHLKIFSLMKEKTAVEGTVYPVNDLTNHIRERNSVEIDEIDELFALPLPLSNNVFNESETNFIAAKKVFDEWMSLVVNWSEFIKTSKILTIFDVYHSVNVLDWFKKDGESRFPSIAVLARIYFCKPASTAFQERIFSRGG